MTDGLFFKVELSFWWMDDRFLSLNSTCKLVYLCLWAQTISDRTERLLIEGSRWHSLCTRIGLVAGLKPQGVKACLKSIARSGLAEYITKGSLRFYWVRGAERKHFGDKGFASLEVEVEEEVEVEVEEENIPPTPLPEPAAQAGEPVAASPTPTNQTEIQKDMDWIVEIWNKRMPAVIPKVKHLTDKRRKALKARVSSPGWVDAADLAIEYIAEEPFYLGEGDRGWVATFDWFIRPDTVLKLDEKIAAVLRKERGETA